MNWITEAVEATASDSDTREDVVAILESALSFVLSDSVVERNRDEAILRARLARLRRIYDRDVDHELAPPNAGA